MNFEDEPYVRIYKRKTITFKRIGWEGRLVLWHLMLEADRSGIVEIGDVDEVEAVSLLTDLPKDIVSRALPVLSSHGITSRHATTIVISKFIEAQEAVRSDKTRSKEYRVRRRDDVSRNEGNDEESSRGVTENHERHKSSLLTVLNNTLHNSTTAQVPAAVVTPESGKPSEAKIPCPGDLELTANQRSSLETSMIPGWAIDALTIRFRAKATADDHELRTLVAWRKSLGVAVSGGWNHPDQRPQKPDAPSEDENKARKKRADDVERRALDAARGGK